MQKNSAWQRCFSWVWRADFFQRIEKLFPANTRKVIGDDKPKLPLRGGLVRTMNLKGIDDVN